MVHQVGKRCTPNPHISPRVVVSAIRATISWGSHLHNGAEKKALTYGGVRAACVFARVCRLLSQCVFPHSCSVPRVPGRSAAQLITIT